MDAAAVKCYAALHAHEATTVAAGDDDGAARRRLLRQKTWIMGDPSTFIEAEASLQKVEANKEPGENLATSADEKKVELTRGSSPVAEPEAEKKDLEASSGSGQDQAKGGKKAESVMGTNNVEPTEMESTEKPAENKKRKQIETVVQVLEDPYLPPREVLNEDDLFPATQRSAASSEAPDEQPILTRQEQQDFKKSKKGEDGDGDEEPKAARKGRPPRGVKRPAKSEPKSSKQQKTETAETEDDTEDGGAPSDPKVRPKARAKAKAKPKAKGQAKGKKTQEADVPSGDKKIKTKKEAAGKEGTTVAQRKSRGKAAPVTEVVEEEEEKVEGEQGRRTFAGRRPPSGQAALDRFNNKIWPNSSTQGTAMEVGVLAAIKPLCTKDCLG